MIVDLDVREKDAPRLAEQLGERPVADGIVLDAHARTPCRAHTRPARTATPTAPLDTDGWARERTWDNTPAQGASRSTDQVPSARATYRSRSCSRFSRPCQNSTDSGTTRNPPQCGGTGTRSPSGYRATSSA